MWKLFQTLDRGIIRLVEIFVAYTLIFMSLIVFLNSMFRFLFGANQNWIEELSRYLMVWLTFIGSCLCVRLGEHVVMDAFLNRLKPKTRRVAKIFINILAAAAMAYMFYLSCYFVWDAFRTRPFSPLLRVAMWIIYLCLPIGFFLTAKGFIGEAIHEGKDGGADK